MKITKITENDFRLFWPVFKSIIEAEETYAFDPHMSYNEAYDLWCLSPQACYVAKENSEVIGTYYLKPNSAGPSAHICNCGYMVSPESRGKGVAKALCQHSQKVAVELGYLAMQFNSVVSTNETAVKLWKKLGYEIVGVIPKAYKHRRFGFVDCFVMYKQLSV